jgi:hypothetical protein
MPENTVIALFVFAFGQAKNQIRLKFGLSGHLTKEYIQSFGSIALAVTKPAIC